MGTRSSAIGAVLLAVVCTSVVAAVGHHLWSDVFLQRSTSEWPKTEGVLTARELVTDANGFVEGSVEYSYTAEGREYQSDRISFTESAKESRDFVADLQQGDAVPVWYDPADPAEAVLRRGDTGSQDIWIWTGGLALGMMIAWLIAIQHIVAFVRR